MGGHVLARKNSIDRENEVELSEVLNSREVAIARLGGFDRFYFERTLHRKSNQDHLPTRE